MATFTTTRAQYETAGFAGRIGLSVANVLGALSSWNEARMTRIALSQLTDRELDDIGLNRSEIDSL